MHAMRSSVLALRCGSGWSLFPSLEHASGLYA
jgi:hypothetical protein